MSDRLPGSSFSNPIKHRGWLIYADDCAGTHPMGYAFVHEDYDPTPVYADDGPSDHRHGWERTVDAAKAEIDEQEDEREDASLLQTAQDLLDTIAARTGSDYVCLHRYTRKPEGVPFYGVNLHTGKAVRHAHADTLAEAMSETIAAMAHVIEQEAA